jgi:hypothetical protein
VDEGNRRSPFPSPQPGVYYLVSSRVASHPALRGRQDVLSPDTGPTAFRQNGQIIAVTRLARFTAYSG